jgi:hypothetical protein
MEPCPSPSQGRAVETRLARKIQKIGTFTFEQIQKEIGWQSQYD